ncbi:30S ribosomal protein S16 [Candidatus Microgenomates bacterium]|jgi:small subunit ribosomal protein S16|nr:MAG: 30S ribosomal protein S16 [Candidatus Microgenomates bacterium]
MSVSLRLSLVGKRNRPIYRIVASQTRYKRNGKSLDQLGAFNPNVNPPIFELDRKKFEEWVKKGAIISTGLYKLLKENNIPLPIK